MKLTHEGPAKQEVTSTIKFTKEDVINALQEFASKRGVQCPPALNYKICVAVGVNGNVDQESNEFIILWTTRDGATNPIYESVRTKKPGDKQ